MGAVFAPLEDVISQSDFIITLVNLSEETRGMFNKALFLKMKRTAVFINTSRSVVSKFDSSTLLLLPRSMQREFLE